MAGERLQKILARSGVASRREAEELIRAGRVTVDGQVAAVGDSVDVERSAIKVDGRRLRPAAPRVYVLLNKPRGYVCTREDPQGRPTVLELVPAALRRRVTSVGRLDFNTEGLLILSDDGDFAQRVAHPRHGCSKTYHVKVKGRPSREQVERLRHGIVLEGRRTRPARIRFLRPTRTAGEETNSWWEVVLQEGRNRQIREMFFRISHPVQRLRRIAIGGLTDKTLATGSWRQLTTAEVERLMAGAAGEIAAVRKAASERAEGTKAGRAAKGWAVTKADPRRKRRPPAKKGGKSRGEPGKGRR